MTMMLLPAISSNAAVSLNSKLLKLVGTSLVREKRGIVRSNLMRQDSQQVAMVGNKPPVLLLDVMGTLVRDPFYEDIPAFFG